MDFRASRRIALVVCLLSGATGTLAEETANEEFFEKQIRPLLVTHCHDCHGEKKQEGGLRLTSRAASLKGGDSGPALAPGKPDASLLIRAVGYLDDLKMPPKGKLPAAAIEHLTQWVSQGAPWPMSEENPSSAATTDDGFQVTTEQQRWWAFQPVRKVGPPAVRNAAWPRDEIDRFIAAGLEAHELTPAPAADRRTWLRRVTFDLIGLPPTPEELAAFEADSSESAFERVVDRLLASQTYGQRWARRWLDVARYADYHDGDPKARDARCEPVEAWRYRNWVVDAFNGDLPFDRFIVHQIAGDLLPPADGAEYYADGLIATTFLTNGVWDRGDADKEKMVSDMVDDNIDTVGKAFLGLTLGCARCHNHKFDPVSQQDYYALAGIFYSTKILKELGAKGDNYTLHRVPLAQKEYVAKRDEQVRQLADLNAKLTALDKKEPKPPADDPERVALETARNTAQRDLLPAPPMVEAVGEGGTPGTLFPAIQDVPIHIRGSYTRLGAVVPRRMPSFLSGDRSSTISGSGRRELADWVASRDNPLTERVIVNRVWHWHFGTGLVPTPNNFGLRSEPPSHPELLDWLAATFIEDGWSLKQLHRRIVLSATYRQASAVPREQIEKDPENRWLGRFTARRLEAEEFRDAMLSVSGRLDVAPQQAASHELEIPYRSLYVQTARWDRSSFATIFDAANPDASEEKRSLSIVAPQALFLLNHPFPLKQAEHLAERLFVEVPRDATASQSQRIRRLYELLFGRSPTEAETAIARQILVTDELPAWTDLTHVLLCSNEFVYVD